MSHLRAGNTTSQGPFNMFVQAGGGARSATSAFPGKITL
jgi:hypothetical protein